MTSIEPFVGELIGAGWEEARTLGEDRAFVVRIRLNGPVPWPTQAVWQAWPVTVSRAKTMPSIPSRQEEDGRRPDGHGLTLTALHAANIARQAEWCPDQVPDLSFRGNELAGEVGEACNVIKKLERERQGWRGSRATLDDLAQELADVVICADLCAVTAGIDLDAAVVAKFNATSAKQGLTTMLQPHPDPTTGGEAPGRDDGWQPIETAPTDTPYTADMPDEAEGEAIGWAISDDGDRLLFLVWWEEQSPGRWTVTKWHPLPASPRSSQKEQG